MEKIFYNFNRKTFLRDLLVINLGFMFFGLAIALMIRSRLGTGPWIVLEVALSKLSHTTPGTMSILVGFLVLVVSLMLKEKIGWGTLANILFIGPWEDFFLGIIPKDITSLLVRVGLLLAAIIVMGMATAIYISVKAGAGPRDSLMLAVKRVSRMSIRMSRASIEISVCLVGWLLGGPLGVGTVIVALLIGPSVQQWFKLLKVNPTSENQVSSLDKNNI